VKLDELGELREAIEELVIRNIGILSHVDERLIEPLIVLFVDRLGTLKLERDDLARLVEELGGALNRLLANEFGFVGHVDGCRSQLADEGCTCGFAETRAALASLAELGERAP